MITCTQRAIIAQHIASLKKEGKKTGFVPTMGALHSGHISLVERARKENDIVVVSIYVNPLQFNNAADLKKYPRVPEKDLQLLQEALCDMVFMPDDTIIGKSKGFEYELGYLDTIMEGYYRPGHFKGVAFIVKALFEIVQPDKAYFGEKDYQQLAVIKKMTKDFNLPVHIVPCPTIRTNNGLAMSSRNERLTEEERHISACIFEGLNYIKNNIFSLEPEVLKAWYLNHIQNHPGMKVEYIELCDSETLAPVTEFSKHASVVACTAVYVGNVRLIDNLKIF